MVAAVQRGCYVETAAELVGIDKVTFYAWLRHGAAIQNEEKPCITPHDEDCLNFSYAIKTSMAQSEIRDLQAIDDAAQQGVWQAAAWKLERKHHGRWGRKVAITDDQGGNFFDGMAKAWAEALESDQDDSPYIEGQVERPQLSGASNGSGG
jgi:hypothetical protein